MNALFYAWLYLYTILLALTKFPLHHQLMTQPPSTDERRGANMLMEGKAKRFMQVRFSRPLHYLNVNIYTKNRKLDIHKLDIILSFKFRNRKLKKMVYKEILHCFVHNKYTKLICVKSKSIVARTFTLTHRQHNCTQTTYNFNNFNGQPQIFIDDAKDRTVERLISSGTLEKVTQLAVTIRVANFSSTEGLEVKLNFHLDHRQ